MNRLKRKAKMDARASKKAKAEESFYDQLLTDFFPDGRGDTAPPPPQLVKSQEARRERRPARIGVFDKEQNDQRHNLWLEDLLVRLLLRTLWVTLFCVRVQSERVWARWCWAG